MANQDYEDDISQMFQVVLDSIPSRVFWKDRDLNFRGGNQLFADDAGANCPADMIGKSDFDFPWAAEAEGYRADDTEVMESGIPKIGIEEPQPQADGSCNWVVTNKVPLRNRNGDVIGILGTYSDITEKKRHEDELRHQAQFDSLTQLPNRLQITECVDEYLASPRNQLGGLLFIDLDHFKVVNDSRGHNVGDEVLIEVARRISDSVPKAKLVARLGGDEFSVLLTNLSSDLDTAKGYLEKACRNIIRALKIPFDVRDNLIYLGASIGISLIDEKSNSVNTVFKQADMAMYSVKVISRNDHAFFSESFDQASAKEHALQNQIRKALEHDDFHLVFQPQVDKNGWLLGAEALIRCGNDDKAALSPADFIPLAETTGLIHPLGDWAINEALKQFAEWRDNSDLRKLPQLSINISSKQFQHPDLVTKLRTAASWHRIPSRQIVLEITESTFFGFEEKGLARLEELKALGFVLAVDDFGTGFSSLSYLARMPIDELKVDRSFVQQMLSVDKVSTVVETIISLAKSLDMNIVAEGVETHPQLNWLEERGCSNFQGYLFSRPLEAEQFAQRYLS